MEQEDLANKSCFFFASQEIFFYFVFCYVPPFFFALVPAIAVPLKTNHQFSMDQSKNGKIIPNTGMSVSCYLHRANSVIHGG
jgi:hypothetical protein